MLKFLMRKPKEETPYKINYWPYPVEKLIPRNKNYSARDVTYIESHNLVDGTITRIDVSPVESKER
ncbi:MAG TPA: hypothetical protein VIK72_09460 [Clostridiaceae bacterium]